MSINFGQFPTPTIPIQPGDVVVGYQLVGGVPTLAQYTMLQLFTGVFPGGVVPPSQGGTGQTTLTANGVLIGEGTNPVHSVGPGTAGQMLVSNGPGVDPSFSNAATISGATIASTTVAATVTGVTAGRADNSTQLATDQFVNQQIISSTANVPFPLVGGVYNQATLGTGLVVVIFVSGGTISSILSVVNGGSGYAVGDLVLVPVGNADAVLRITNVVGGVVQSGGVSVIYGGTGYTTGAQVTAVPVPPGQRTVAFTGVLTSNVTFIIQNGTFLTAARRVQFNNNTTGAFTVTVKLSNGAGGSVGTGVVLAQGSNNSTAALTETDGVNDVWLADTLLGLGINSPPPIGNTTPNSGAFTTVIATGAITPAQIAGIVGTTTNNAAQAGSVGEFPVNSTSGTALTTAVGANATSISLTAGDWDVSGTIQFNAGAGCIPTSILAGISTTSATAGAFGSNNALRATLGTAQAQLLSTPVTRILLAATTTVFLVAAASFTGGTCTADGFIRARRVR